MKNLPLVIGASLLSWTAAFAQSKPEMQKMADEWAAAFNKGDATKVASFYRKTPPCSRPEAV
jgi:hypothetical protein